MSRISKDRVFTTLNEDVALTIAFYHLCRYEDQVERERVTLLECERTTLATFADWFLNEGGAPLKTNFDLFLILCDKYGFFPMVRSKRGVRKMTSLPFSYGDIVGSYYKRKPTQTVD